MMSPQVFGCVAPNPDWPVRCRSKFVLCGPVMDAYYREFPDKPPFFRTESAAKKMLNRLYRTHGQDDSLKTEFMNRMRAAFSR